MTESRQRSQCNAGSASTWLRCKTTWRNTANASPCQGLPWVVDFGEQTEMDYRCLDRMEIRHTLADVAAITRNHDYAAKLYDEVLAEIPDDVDALVGLSYATNDPERATALAKRALAVDPDHPGAIDRVAELEANE